MLANVERLTVVGDVLLDTKRQQFRDADAASRKKRGSHLIPARRIRYKLCHLFTRQRGTVLLLLVHRRQANERKIPGTRMHLISIVIDCRPDNLRERVSGELLREPIVPAIAPYPVGGLE